MNNILPLLAIETSNNICGACVYFSDEKYFSSKVILKHSHSEKLFEVIKSVISQASISKNELKAISVSAGPGSFTGLRIGMSAAKGMAQALSIPIIPVPTFEALALQISQFLPNNGSFYICNKVGRDELYFAKFQIKGNNYIFKEELKIIPVSDFYSVSIKDKIFGNIDIENSGERFDITNIPAPDSEFVAKWAAEYGIKNQINEIDFVEPNYLKDFIFKGKKI